MVKTDNGRYYTDFRIVFPWDFISRLDMQENFVREHFDTLWKPLGALQENVAVLTELSCLSERAMKKLERHIVLKALQDFMIKIENPSLRFPDDLPMRKDGTRWTAFGIAIPAGFNADDRDLTRVNDNLISGLYVSIQRGQGILPFENTVGLEWHSFLTKFHDRQLNEENENALTDSQRNLIYSCFLGIDPVEVNNATIEKIPDMIECGYFVRNKDGKLIPDIPVLEIRVWRVIEEMVGNAVDELIKILGEDFRSYLRYAKMKVPAHLNSVPDFQLYFPATNTIQVLVERNAMERGLHMKGVDYICTPCLMVYERSDS